VGTRLKRDKGTLFGSNGIKVTASTAFFNAQCVPVNKPNLLDGYQRRHRQTTWGSPAKTAAPMAICQRQRRSTSAAKVVALLPDEMNVMR
jgi:hypothetical protein